MMISTRAQGREAESKACNYLQAHGLKLIARNYSSFHGEIDLIMQDEQTLVFVEVKCRKSLEFGGALGSITPRKQSRLLKTALYYLQQEKPVLKNMRFDVVALQGNNRGEYDTEWLQNVIEQRE